MIKILFHYFSHSVPLSLSQSLHLKLSSSPKTLSSSHPLSVTLSSSLIHCRRPDPIVPSCQSPQTQAANHLSVSSVVVVVVWVDRRRCVRRHQWAVVGFVDISGWLGWVSWWWVWVLCLLVGGRSEFGYLGFFFFGLLWNGGGGGGCGCGCYACSWVVDRSAW